MILADLINNNKTRRKESMLQRLYDIKYFFVLAVLLALPMLVMPTTSKAGVAADGPQGIGQRLIDQTDMGAWRLVYFVDRRDRESYVQVTNTSSNAVNIHVQIFDVTGGGLLECEECDFNDTLTPEDTHVYDAENFVTNFGAESQCNLDDGHYGFVVISHASALPFKTTIGGPLIGMFRVIDDEGYEYRTNAAGKELLEFEIVPKDEEIFVDGKGGSRFDELVNFELADGNVFADLVGITFWEESQSKVNASPSVGTSFGMYDRKSNDSIEIYTEHEVPGSCSPAIFSCSSTQGFDGIGNMDKGIDNSLPNSKIDNNRVCQTERLDANTSGWLHMPFSGFACIGEFGAGPNFRCIPRIQHNAFFVGFIGLNNGDGTGSMDSWWTQRPRFSRRNGMGPAPVN